MIEVDTIFDEDPVGPWITLWAVARFKAQGHLIGTPDWERLSETIQPQILMGSKVTGVEYARAQDAVFALNWLLEDAFERAPIILCPTTGGQTPRVGHDGTIDGVETPGWVQFTYGLNMSRNPAGSVCTGLSSAGLPIGPQVIGRQRAEADVLTVMATLETLIGFDRLPTI